MNTTNEFSFVLRPSEYGIGVFAAHDIAAGTLLQLWGKENEEGRSLAPSEVPERFRQFCLARNDRLIGPPDFSRMAVGWYLNHSKTPNAEHRGYAFFANTNIREGTEITIDYNSLEEPEEMKEAYYRNDAQ